MKSIKNLLLSSAVVLAHFSINAQVKLDLETCLKMADTANLSIINALLDVEINSKERSAYLSARLPHVNYSGDYKYNAIIPGQVVPGAFFGGAPGTFTTVQFGVPYNLSNTFQLSQVIFNPQLEYGLAALKINKEIIEIQKQLTTQDVKHQVASTFFNLQACKRQLDYVNGNILNMDRLIANMEAMSSQQLVIPIEVDKLKINRMTLLNSKGSLQATHDQLESLLKILIGVDLSENVQLKSDELIEKSILVDNTIVSFPEIDMINAQQKMNIEEHKGTNMAYLPNLSFYAAYSYNYNMKPENDFRQGIEGAFIGLRIDWTLFDGLEKFHKQKVNALNAEKLVNQKTLLQQQLDLKVNNSKRQIEVQSNALTLSKEQLKLSQNVYDQTAAKFELGTVSSNELITADNNLQQAQTNLVASYIQLRQAELEYLRAIGNIK